MLPSLVILSILCIALGVGLYLVSRQRLKNAGMPGGRLVYSDTRGWESLEEPLYDPELGLAGKPDYLVEKGDRIIPVEVKSSRPPEAPYDSHLYQLAAYCLLVQQVYGSRPPYGILHYTGHSQRPRTFQVDYTQEMERSIRLLIQEIRHQEKQKETPRSHQVARRCTSCGFRSACDQRLG